MMNHNAVKKITMSLILLLMMFLSACARPIPKPGETIYQGQAPQVMAMSQLVGKSLTLHITQVSGSYTLYAASLLKVNFNLVDDYVLYQIGQISKRLSQGSYGYDIDFHQINHATLNLTGANGLVISLLFNTEFTGKFYAQSNDSEGAGMLQGNFVIQ